MGITDQGPYYEVSAEAVNVIFRVMLSKNEFIKVIFQPVHPLGNVFHRSCI